MPYTSLHARSVKKELYRQQMWDTTESMGSITGSVAILEQEGCEAEHLIRRGYNPQAILAINNKAGVLARTNRHLKLVGLPLVRTKTGDYPTIVSKLTDVTVAHFDSCNSLAGSDLKEGLTLLAGCPTLRVLAVNFAKCQDKGFNDPKRDQEILSIVGRVRSITDVKTFNSRTAKTPMRCVIMKLDSPNDNTTMYEAITSLLLKYPEARGYLRRILLTTTEPITAMVNEKRAPRPHVTVEDKQRIMELHKANKDWPHSQIGAELTPPRSQSTVSYIIRNNKK